MPFEATTINARIDDGLGSVALLNTSCQGVIEAEIAEVASPWYDKLDAELGAAENLVLTWRQSGFLYFTTDILQAIASAGTGFTRDRDAIDARFEALDQHFDPTDRDRLLEALRALETPVQTIIAGIDGYLAKARTLEQQMGDAEQAMRVTIGEVQAQEAAIQDQIDAINAKVSALTAQVKTDREAIAKARSERTTGIVETIFGVILAPVTGGASLVLAGIGAASIADAQSKIDAMEAQISDYQGKIAGDQAAMTADQQIVSTLNGLTMSTGLVLSDLDAIASALDALRTSWSEFDGEFAGVLGKLAASTSAGELVVAQAWFDAACTEWALVSGHVQQLLGASVSTRKIRIG